RVGRFTWGAGAQALDYGSEPVIVPDSSTGGRRGLATGATFTAADLLGVASLVYRRGLIATGVSAKYARQQIGGYAADAWAGDIGVAVAVFDIFALGASVQNLGGDFGGGTRLPRRTRVAITMNYVDPQSTFRLLSTLEAQWPSGRKAVLVQGVEGGIVAGGVGLVGRVGYATRSPTSDASRFSLGGGVELGHVHLDYAYQAFDLLGGATRCCSCSRRAARTSCGSTPGTSRSSAWCPTRGSSTLPGPAARPGRSGTRGTTPTCARRRRFRRSAISATRCSRPRSIAIR